MFLPNISLCQLGFYSTANSQIAQVVVYAVEVESGSPVGRNNLLHCFHNFLFKSAILAVPYKQICVKLYLSAMQNKFEIVEE
jgi:hypothetical protein